LELPVSSPRNSLEAPLSAPYELLLGAAEELPIAGEELSLGAAWEIS